MSDGEGCTGEDDEREKTLPRTSTEKGRPCHKPANDYKTVIFRKTNISDKSGGVDGQRHVERVTGVVPQPAPLGLRLLHFSKPAETETAVTSPAGPG